MLKIALAALLVALPGVVLTTPATDALDAAGTQVKAELAAAESQKSQDAALITPLRARIAELEAQDAPPSPPPPQTTAPWPSGWDDSRFATNANTTRKSGLNSGQVIANVTIVDTSGEPVVVGTRYTLRDSRVRGREGPRIAGSNTTIEGSYIEVAGSGDDHGDGIQCYTGQRTNTANIVIRNTHVKMLPGTNNAGIFFADYCLADFTLENVKVDGDGSPNGAIWLPCNGADKGVRRLSARNVEVSNTNGRQLIEIWPGSRSCAEIVEWTNVHRPDGSQVSRP